jgi:hypothetical protein
MLDAAPPREAPAGFPKPLKAMVVVPSPALLRGLADYEAILSIWLIERKISFRVVVYKWRGGRVEVDER